MSRRPTAPLSAVFSALVLALATLVLGSAPASAGEVTSEPPRNVRVVNLQPMSFTVDWDEPDGADYYHVSVSPLWAGTRMSHGEPVTYTGLVWDTEYTITVTAFYTEFKDERSRAQADPITVRTPVPEDFTPPNAPTNLRIERDTHGRPAFLLFDPSTEGVGELWYELHLDASQVEGLEWLSGVWDTTNTQRFDLSFVPINAQIWNEGDTVRLYITARDKKRNQSPPSEALELTCCPF